MQNVPVFAQKEANIWYFGNYAGLSFNTSPPSAITNSVMTANEGCASIADKKGNLLFYSDGVTIWNKNHQIMTNGNGLFGNYSSTHSCLVVKYPGNDSMYLIFTSGAYGSMLGVCYSIIDMRLSGQLGAVTSKNIKLLNSSAEKIAAINHANQNDIWVVIPKHGSDTIYSYLVTSAGINLNAVKNTTGISLNGPCVGQIKLSSNSLKLAYSNWQDSIVVISDFNNSSGSIVNNRIIFGVTHAYALEFSPNSKYLYVSDYKNGLSQCEIPNSSVDFSIACKTIDSNVSSFFGSLQLGPDSNIYSVVSGSDYIGIIKKPNNYYTSCDYLRNAINLGGKQSRVGLPAFNQSVLASIGLIKSDSACFGDSSKISINIDTNFADSINWFIGDNSIPLIGGSKVNQIKYLSPDLEDKTILVKVYFNSNVENYYGVIHIKPSPILDLLADTSICLGDSIILTAFYSGAKYLWQDSSTNSTFKVKNSGNFWVKSDFNGCFKIDSVNIKVYNFPIVNLGNDTTICDSAKILLTIPTKHQTYLWNDFSKESNLLVEKEGIYTVIVGDSGCSSKDQINIYYVNKPQVNLISDTSICDGLEFTLRANSNKSNFLWSNFSTDSFINILQNGTYWVKVYNVCGIATDTVKIKIIDCDCNIFLPNAFTPNGNYVNEIFKPVSNCEMVNYHLQIFNQWGIKIFESTNPTIGWEGKLNNIIQSNNVFVYLLEADLVNYNKSSSIRHVSIKGNVTLLN